MTQVTSGLGYRYLFFTCLLVAAAIEWAWAEPPPNIILMMADDMGFSDLGCYGGEIATPHLDQLAADGIRFTQFYNNAKCTTTRASLLSGMYPRGSGNTIPLEIPTLGEVMRELGYQTALSGKWHLGPRSPQRPIDRGFDEYYGLMDGCCNFFNPAQPDPPAKNNKLRVFGHNAELIHEFPENYYTTDAFADHTVETIRRFHQQAKPFLIHLAFTAPHYPLHAPPADIAKYRGRYRMGWEELRRQRYERQLKMGLLPAGWALSPSDSKAYAWEAANQDWEDLRMATYAAMVDRLDQNVGKVMAVLEELGIEEETVVLFLSDNGGCTEEPGGRDDSQTPGVKETYTAVGPSWGWAQNTPFRRYKSSVNEGGISTPLIVRWPGKIATGSMTDQVGHIIDILPTCVELASANYPSTFGGQPTIPLEGRSLIPVLRGGIRSGHPQLFWEWGGNGAMRQGDWKLVWDALQQPPRWELFNIVEDRTELRDRAAEFPEQVIAMKEAYAAWATKTGRSNPGEGRRKQAAGDD